MSKYQAQLQANPTWLDWIAPRRAAAVRPCGLEHALVLAPVPGIAVQEGEVPGSLVWKSALPILWGEAPQAGSGCHLASGDAHTGCLAYFDSKEREYIRNCLFCSR